MTAPLLPALLGAKKLTTETAERTDGLTAARVGVVMAVSARGLDVVVSGGVVSAAHLDSYAPAVGDTVVLTKVEDSWFVLGRPVGTATPTDNSAPGTGVGPTILDAARTSGTPNPLASSTGAVVTVPGYTVSFYHPPGHTVLIWATFGWFGTNAADWMAVSISDTISGVGVGFWGAPAIGASFSRADAVFGVAGSEFGGTQRSYSMRIQRSTGAGTVSIVNSTTARGIMIALDLGDDSVIRTM